MTVQRSISIISYNAHEKYVIIKCWKYPMSTTTAKRYGLTDPMKLMMTSSDGNIFGVTGHLCGEFAGHGEFLAQRPVTQCFDVFFNLRLNKRLSKQSWGCWFEMPSHSLWRHSMNILPDKYKAPHNYVHVLSGIYHIYGFIGDLISMAVYQLPLHLLRVTRGGCLVLR